MEPGLLFGGSENLFKYLFLGGLVTLVFCIVFPMDKANKLELSKISLEIEIDRLRSENKSIKKNIARYHRMGEQDKAVYYPDLQKQAETNYQNTFLIKQKEKEVDAGSAYISKLNRLTNWGIIFSALFVLAGVIGWACNFNELNHFKKYKSGA